MAVTRAIKRYFIPLFILLLFIAGGIIVHKKRAAQVARVAKQTIAPWVLHVAVVQKTPVDSGFPTLAKVASSQDVKIMARITGKILTMGPREGIAVHRGDQLVHLDTREIENKLLSLKAQLISAQAETVRTRDELARETKLIKQGGSSASAVETRRTAAVAAGQRIKSLEHEIHSLEVQVGYGIIKSPVDGIIAARPAEPGDMCLPGQPLYTIMATGKALIRVVLPQNILHQVKIGAPVHLFFKDQQLVVPVSRIFPSVDARALGYVESDVDAIPFGLPSGSRVNARIILRQIDDAFQVPYNSLLCGKGDARCHVFVVQRDKGKNVLKTVPVKLLLRGHAGIAVDGPLKVGEQVVIAHESILLQLKNGDAVTVARGELP